MWPDRVSYPGLTSQVPYLLRYAARLREVVVVLLLFYVNGKHLRSCRGGQLT